MSEASGNPVDDKSGIGETITTALRQPSFLRVVLVLAALVVVFVGMRLAAPILDPSSSLWSWRSCSAPSTPG